MLVASCHHVVTHYVRRQWFALFGYMHADFSQGQLQALLVGSQMLGCQKQSVVVLTLGVSALGPFVVPSPLAVVRQDRSHVQQSLVRELAGQQFFPVGFQAAEN